MKCTVYVLIDPFTKHVRYVGKTVRFAQRMKEHRQAIRREDLRISHFRVYRWARKVFRNGKSPLVSILAEVDTEEEANRIEIMWIEIFKKKYDLTNSTIGGEGVIGLKVSDETRAKQSATRKGRKCPWLIGNKFSLGRKQSEEAKNKVRLSKLGVKKPPFSDEWKANMSKSKIGNTNSKGKKRSLEQIQKLNAGRSRRWQEYRIAVMMSGGTLERSTLHSYRKKSKQAEPVAPTTEKV